MSFWKDYCLSGLPLLAKSNPIELAIFPIFRVICHWWGHSSSHLDPLSSFHTIARQDQTIDQRVQDLTTIPSGSP